MSSIVYVRTPEGQAAAYDQVSAMPRKLRSLLKVIDGKTSDAVLTTSLKAFGDVRGLLRSLLTAGLIQPLAEDEVSKQASAAIASGPVATSLQAQKNAALFASTAPIGGFEQTQGAYPTQSFYHNTTQASSPLGAEAQQARQQALQAILQGMSNFVLTHVPQHALVILSELEDISSMEQLAVMLGGYELMVREAGAVTQEHMAQLRKALKEWM
ncbi:MAG: hypothetical protein ACRC2U_07285 [Aeromonas sp.]